jgi:ubiquinone/menaquinone biosynthesis C-methylase UbiE
MNATERRGLDGLTSAELRADRQEWWDTEFTQLLLRHIPAGTRKLLDVGCGLATAAHALLPHFPQLEYVGVDADEHRLSEAEQSLAGRAYAERVDLRAGRAERMPCADGEFGVALIIATLQHVPDPAAVLKDMARVLVPGGVLVAVEPDHLAHLVYFNGPVEDVTAAIRALNAERRRVRRPADASVGAAVAGIAEEQSFVVVEFFPHFLGPARKLAARDFFADEARRVGVNTQSAVLPSGAREVEVCRSALAAAEERIGSATVGWGCHCVPVFVCVARKP